LPETISPSLGVTALTTPYGAVVYEKAVRAGEVKEPFYRFTRAKKVLMIIGLLLLAYGGWTYWQFQRLLA